MDVRQFVRKSKKRKGNIPARSGCSFAITLSITGSALKTRLRK